MSDPYTISNFNHNSVVYFIRPVSYTPAMCWDCESGNLGVLADWSYPGVTWFFWFALFVIVVVNLIFASRHYEARFASIFDEKFKSC